MSQRGDEEMGVIDLSRTAKGSGYAVVWCADFKLQAVVRRVNWREQPVALVDDTKRQSVVLCRNVAAARQGVEAGMRTVQGVARCPDLRVERPAATAETAAGRLLLETALSWVPGVEETEEGLLTLDLSSQSEEAWEESARRIRGRLYDEGLEAMIGLGETPSLARIATFAAQEQGMGVYQLPARERLERLDQLPLTVAETGAELNERLELWGIDSPGAFARLEREAVAARLGEEGVALWLRLTGRWRRPLKYARLERLFEDCHDFDFEVRELEPLLFMAKRLIDELSARVGRTGRAVIAVHVLLADTTGRCEARRLALPEPLLDEAVLFRLVSGYLEGLEWKAPLERVCLRFEPSDPVASQRQLFGAGLRNRFQFDDTMKRLRRLVGSERVGALRARDTHQPGAVEVVPLPPEIPEVKEHRGPPVTGLVFHRFASAIPARVTCEQGVPVWVKSSRVVGQVIRQSGPWRRSGHWWHRGSEWKRLEWDVEVVKQGVFRLVECQGEWRAEGVYE
ncbi:MAG: DNA polymerase Y family protein [Verrucomicrobiota bacterium]